MDFRGKDPGAVQFGNFINYYQFNSAYERVALLPNQVWLAEEEIENETSPYIVLDVGCNAGDFTQLLYDYLSQRIARNIHILGVDIDPLLIKRANETNKNSQQIEMRCLDVMNDNDFSTITKYLDKWSAHKFDAVCCFSITMWIHLNHNDAGLMNFLENYSSIAKLFVVEPQPWKCYRTAVRRMQRSAKEGFPNFSVLEWRTNVEKHIQNFLEEQLKRKKIYETNPTKWMRKICFYR